MHAAPFPVDNEYLERVQRFLEEHYPVQARHNAHRLAESSPAIPSRTVVTRLNPSPRVGAAGRLSLATGGV
jgi:hypothetical protein